MWLKFQTLSATRLRFSIKNCSAFPEHSCSTLQNKEKKKKKEERKALTSEIVFLQGKIYI